jgi:hypothetical protein
MFIIIIGFLVLNFFALLWLSFFFVGKGSDHYFYDFYIESIRRNRNKFFSIFPNFINQTYITDPQFFFWLLSFLPKGRIKWVGLLLNPFLVTLMGFIVFLFLRLEFHLSYDLILVILIATLVTPQFFYGQNARIYGLNSRGIGMVLMVFYLICSYYFVINQHVVAAYVFAVITAYLIWGTSLFAQQALVFYSLTCAIFFGWFDLILVLMVSVLVFYVLHTKYARLYFINRWKYFIIYKNVFADTFILKARYSIWRDFIYDFWLFKKNGLKKQLLYIYYNGAIAIIFLNPAVLFCIYILMFNFQIINTSIAFFCGKIIIAGVIIFILTSFRYTRVLGEPERYLELIIPFVNIFAIPILINSYSYSIAIWLIFLLLVISIFQIFVFAFFLKDVGNSNVSMIETVKNSINESITNDVKVSFFCNNFNWSSYNLNADWSFVHYYPTSNYLANIPVISLIEEYPFIKEEFVHKIQQHYDVMFILIDRRKWNKNLETWNEMQIIIQNEKFILYKRIEL